MTPILIEGNDVLIISIVVWFLGEYLTGKIGFLRQYSIPVAVTGGLLFSTLISFVYMFGGYEISFDMRIRDLLLLAFFSTIGLSAQLPLLKAGGKLLGILLLIAIVFLVIQDITGVLLVKLIGHHPGYGLFGGSISLAGGYGTAIAWGEAAEQAGLRGAKELGAAFATFGLIVGGMLGGPIAEHLIKKHNHLIDPGTEATLTGPQSEQSEKIMAAPPIRNVLGTLLMLALCIELGDLVNRFLFSNDVMLPGFLTAMIVGIVISNTSGLFKLKIDISTISRAGELSLQLFLSMSLMSMQLWTLTNAIGPILFILTAQVLVITVFASYVVYHLMGRSYDACVITAGFIGLGLGATPVGIANMNAITGKYGPSAKAFLVVPLVGAFFIDLVNALVIKFFITLPIISQAPL